MKDSNLSSSAFVAKPIHAGAAYVNLETITARKIVWTAAGLIPWDFIIRNPYRACSQDAGQRWSFGHCCLRDDRPEWPVARH